MPFSRIFIWTRSCYLARGTMRFETRDSVEMLPVYPPLCVDLNMFGLQSVVHNDRIQCIQTENGLLVVAARCLLTKREPRWVELKYSANSDYEKLV